MKGKYFLGSVGTAEAFRIDNGELTLAFRSKTLTDSGINISTTKDDIRAGTGAPIQFSFYHDPNIEITLTDVLFDEAYVEAQLGTKFVPGGIAYYTEPKELVGADGGKLELTKEPQPMPVGCGNSAAYVWFSEKGQDEWHVAVAVADGGNKFSITDPKFIQKGKLYCVRYLYQNDAAKIAEITSNMIPEELFLVITAPIYAGDACSASNGKAAGTITFEIPRFKLAGTQDFAFNMSSNATMSLSGNVLADESGCDITSSNLMRIITQYENAQWYDDLVELVADEDFLKKNDIPHIYGVYKNGSVLLIDNKKLKFTPELSEAGQWAAAGAETITIEGSTISDSVTVVDA